MSNDPWRTGLPIPGVSIAYNAKVRVIEGEQFGKVGWVVQLAIDGNEPMYTLELESGEGDIDAPQFALRSA